MLFHDTRMPTYKRVTCFDASEYGYGCVDARCTADDVNDYLRYSDRWRFSNGGAPRYSVDQVVRSCLSDQAWKEKAAGVPNVDRSFLERQWQVVASTKWKTFRHIVHGEARAFVFAAKHAARDKQSFGSNVTIFGDSLSSILA